MTKEELKNKCVDTSCPVLSINNQNMRRIAELELKIKHLTEHLEPQAMTALFEQVEEEVRQEQMIEELHSQNKALEEKYNTCLRENTGMKIYNAYIEKKLFKAKEIIKRMLPLMPSGYNDMGNCDFIWEVKEQAEQFLKEVE